MFKDLHADVRRLPNRFGGEEPELPALPPVEAVVVEEPAIEEPVVEEVVIEEPVVEEVVEEVVDVPAPVEAEYVDLEPVETSSDLLHAEYEELEPREVVEEEVVVTATPVIEEVTLERSVVEPIAVETVLETEYEWPESRRYEESLGDGPTRPMPEPVVFAHR